MLRSTRRPARALSVALTLLAASAILWPAGVVAAPAGTSASKAGGQAKTPAPRSSRAPVVTAQGVWRATAGRGQGPKKPLETLKNSRSGRPTAATTKAPRAPLAAPVSVQATPSASVPATSFGPWDGLDQQTTGLEPPDPWVAAGPNDLVQTTNTTVRFRNRDGVQASPDLTISNFFNLDHFVPVAGAGEVSIQGVGDPRWVYDTKHNRWLGLALAWHCDQDGAASVDSSYGYLLGAISTSGDPAGAYYHMSIQYTGFLPDFPSIGTSADKIAWSANEYGMLSTPANCTDNINFDSGSMVAFDWAQLLTYPAEPAFQYHISDTNFAFRPALQPQATSNAIFGVVEASPGATTSNVGYFTITGTLAANTIAVSPVTDLTAASVVPAFADPPQPVDPGGMVGPNVVDRRPTDAIWQNNVLTFASTIGCDPAGGASGENRDCARVTQLNTATATPTRVQDMLIATTGKDTFYPGIGQSQSGTLHVVYSESSSGQGISSFDRYQLKTDAVHTLSPAITLASGGTVSYTGTRWGDFVGVAQDPRDTNAVWQGNEYAKSGGQWATKVSELQTEGSTYHPLDPVRLLDSRLGNGLSGAFAANVARTVQITGRGGIPSGAVAITGNLTVTQQTEAGYASLTPLPINKPTTSTLNFPLGDNRANNITSPLSDTGAVSIVYRATPGKTAHFLLDVTGYFVNDGSGATYYNVVTSGVPTPLRVLDTRFGTGLTGAFAANTNRTFQVTGPGAIPAGAIAVTGNLTVTTATARGYVTLSTNPPPTNPATSTINFPGGDRRANGITVKLSATGTLTAVYKAPPGSTTDLILDVTGYYQQDLAGARFVALTPGRRMDTRFTAPPLGLTGPFGVNVHRTLVVEPYEGVPANAIAISGNLTIVSPTSGGYVSMTPDPNDNPPTSTINFPVGDTRANGVTGPLSAGGDASLVFRAASGQTHMILDLMGYFRP